MRINIESIPHSKQRYPTCGDWWYEGVLNLITQEKEPWLQIRVSEELPKATKELIVMHELAEVFMCAANGVTQKQVDDFDMNYEANRKDGDESEPGDQPDAPYFHQHQIAMMVERLVAYKMGVNWADHEAAIEKLP